jgi:hypothetical protein
MTVLARKLSNHLCEQGPVIEAFWFSHLRLVHSILAGALETHTDGEPNWQQLLSWASVLSQSDLDDHVELAIIAAVAALLTARVDSEMARDAALFVLENCSNTPTIKLAKERGLIRQLAYSSRLPALIRKHQTRLQHFIFDDFAGTILPVTDFQERIWDTLGQEGDAALSAPTSAGKSFVLMRWLVQSLLSRAPGAVVTYVVPSRALISQMRRNIEDMLRKCGIRPRIVTLPTLYREDSQRQTILVMTQERIERLFAVNSDIAFQTIVVDEAHKLGEGPRGVILQRVIDKALSRHSDCRIIMAAPNAENAEILLPRSSHHTVRRNEAKIVTDSHPTVLQNLFWVTPIPRRRARWKIVLVRQGQVRDVGEFQLKGGPTGKIKKLAALAYHLGHTEGGNIVFANGAAEAENVALLLRGHVEAFPDQFKMGEDVLDLARLAKDTVHPSYPLAETLPYGIGIHYGDMPEIARREQEHLFDQGKLSFLVCTSTLLEGVNLPCRNLFIWGPRQGRGQPMTEHSFWNLAGRAGRWGREFAGNIFCIDVDDPSQWPYGPPIRRRAQIVSHAGARVLTELNSFREFTAAENPAVASRQNRYFEQILGELISVRLEGHELSSVGWARWGTDEQLRVLKNIIESVTERITAPPVLISRHCSINPFLISGFFEYITSLPPGDADSFMPMSPDMPDALRVLSYNLRIADEYLGADFGNQKQCNLKAKITIDWIRGLPLGRIIGERIEYLSSVKNNIKIPAEIRAIMELINRNTRYLIPKYLSCYSDCVSLWYKEIGRDDLVSEVTDIQDMLETGVAERTMIALVGLGLSRTAAVELSNRIPDTQMSIDRVISWLRGRPLEAYGISPVIIREVTRVLETNDVL